MDASIPSGARSHRVKVPWLQRKRRPSRSELPAQGRHFRKAWAPGGPRGSHGHSRQTTWTIRFLRGLRPLPFRISHDQVPGERRGWKGASKSSDRAHRTGQSPNDPATDLPQARPARQASATLGDGLSPRRKSVIRRLCRRAVRADQLAAVRREFGQGREKARRSKSARPVPLRVPHASS